MVASPAPSPAPTPADLAALRSALEALLAALPTDIQALDGLKNPGAWPDRPLPANPGGGPIYVQLPAVLQFVNLSPAALAAQVARTPVTSDGQTGSVLSIQRPLA